MLRKLRLKFQPSGSGVEQVLGELESRVMNIVWDEPGATARDVHRRLGKRELAYTTIVTVLDRLFAKALVRREKVGRRFAYTGAIAKEEFERQLTRDVLSGLLKEDSRPVVNTFVELVSSDPALLDELEELIRKRRG